jgi:hypothetical protein
MIDLSLALRDSRYDCPRRYRRRERPTAESNLQPQKSGPPDYATWNKTQNYRWIRQTGRSKTSTSYFSIHGELYPEGSRPPLQRVQAIQRRENPLSVHIRTTKTKRDASFRNSFILLHLHNPSTIHSDWTTRPTQHARRPRRRDARHER